MMGWLIRRYAGRYGYRAVPPRDVWAVFIERCDPSQLTDRGMASRSRAFIARRLAREANDVLDRYETFDVLKQDGVRA